MGAVAVPCPARLAGALGPKDSFNLDEPLRLFCEPCNVLCISGYQNKRDCTLLLPDRTAILLETYIWQTKDEVKLKFRLIYTAEDWLFIKNVILLSESGHRVVIDVAEKRDSKVLDDGTIVEWSDITLKLDEVAAFTNATSIKCRLSGQFRKDFDLTTNQLMAIREVLAMYIKLTRHDSETEVTANKRAPHSDPTQKIKITEKTR